MQQYLVTDETCNYRDLVLAMLLADVVVLEEEALATYQKELEHGQDRKTTITFHEFSLPNMNL